MMFAKKLVINENPKDKSDTLTQWQTKIKAEQKADIGFLEGINYSYVGFFL